MIPRQGAWNLLKSMAERAEQEGRVCKETFVHNTLLHLRRHHFGTSRARLCGQSDHLSRSMIQATWMKPR